MNNTENVLGNTWRREGTVSSSGCAWRVPAEMIILGKEIKTHLGLKVGACLSRETPAFPPATLLWPQKSLPRM